jgi:hypothetical protein
LIVLPAKLTALLAIFIPAPTPADTPAPDDPAAPGLLF